MCPAVCLLSFLCVVSAARATSFESEEVVPVRVDARLRGRFWKRSEEQPSYTLSAFGTRLTLKLAPDPSFMARAFTIQRLRAHPHPHPHPRSSMNRTEESGARLRSCFYSGSVDQDENSHVAVSLCSGILGSFITEGAEYVIEPKVRGGRGPDAAERLHVIRRRTGVRLQGAPLLLDSSSEEARAESLTLGGGDARRAPRQRRFVSAPRFIETLVVADATMTQFYGDEIKVR